MGRSLAAVAARHQLRGNHAPRRQLSLCASRPSQQRSSRKQRDTALDLSVEQSGVRGAHRRRVRVSERNLGKRRRHASSAQSGAKQLLKTARQKHQKLGCGNAAAEEATAANVSVMEPSSRADKASAWLAEVAQRRDQLDFTRTVAVTEEGNMGGAAMATRNTVQADMAEPLEGDDEDDRDENDDEDEDCDDSYHRSIFCIGVICRDLRSLEASSSIHREDMSTVRTTIRLS